MSCISLDTLQTSNVSYRSSALSSEGTQILVLTLIPVPPPSRLATKTVQIPCVLGRILNSTCKGTDRHRHRCCMVLRSRESPILPLLPIYRDPPRFRVERCSSTCLFPGEGAGWWIHKRSCELRGSDDCTPSQRQVSCYRCRPDRTDGEAPAALVPPQTVVRLAAAATATTAAAFLPIASPSAAGSRSSTRNFTHA